MKDFMTLYMPAIRKFWQDYDEPFFMISAIPLQNDVSSRMTGMGLTDGFSVRYRGPMDLHKTRITAHEVSHHWLGIKLKYDQQTMENNWFNEGFNDYVAVYNLSSSGLFDKTNFLAYMNNENFTAHYTSPVRNVPADAIEANFFNDGKSENLSYQRGLIYAFYLDNQIRAASKGKQTIRHFLLALYQHSKKKKIQAITTADFCKVIAPFLPGKNVKDEIDRYMHKGELIDFSKVASIPEFKISYVQGVPKLALPMNLELKKIYY